MGQVHLQFKGKDIIIESQGNGRFDAVNNALKQQFNLDYTNLTYSEHAMEIGATSRAIAYVGITDKYNKTYFGAGIDTDITTAFNKSFTQCY